MCGGGGGNQVQSTSTQNLDPELKKRYLELLDRGKGVANLPYVGYDGARLAGFSGDQEAAFAGIRDAQGIYEGDLAEARRQAGIAAMPQAGDVGTFDAAALERYGDPYSQDVIEATRAEIERQGELARRDLDTRAGTSGGIGGYGPGVRANLERQEQFRNQADVTGRTIAGLKSQNFAQAQNQFNTEQNRTLAARQADAGRAGAAAQQYTGIAGAGQDYALRGANALYGAGATQQGQAQRGLDIPYSDFLAQRQYPFDTTNFLSGIYRGYPTTTSTTTTQPGANPWVQGAGLGIAALGAFGQAGGFGLFRDGGIVGRRVHGRGRRMARGGRVRRGMASGGIVGYQSGGPVDVYGGMSNADLGRLVDQGNVDAYDEYVRRIATGGGNVTPASDTPAAKPSRRLTLGDMGIKGMPKLKMPDWVPGWGPETAPVSAHDPGIDDSSVPMMGPRYDPRGKRPSRPTDTGIAAPAIGHNGGPPLEDAGITAGYTPSPSMADRGGIAATMSDKEMQALAKTVGGASADPEAKTPDAPSWAMPLIVAGLSMMASRNPSALGALGESGIAGLSAYIDQKRIDAASAAEAAKFALELEQFDEEKRSNRASEDIDVLQAAGLADYRKSQADVADRRAAAYEKRTDALNKRTAAGGSGGSATERIIDKIMAADKTVTYPQAVRMAHGAAVGDRNAMKRVAIAYANGKAGTASSIGFDAAAWDAAYTQAMQEAENDAAAASGDTDPLDMGEDDNPLGLDFEDE